MRRRDFLVAAGSLLLPFPVHASAIRDVRADAGVAEAVLLQALLGARYRLLGEIHDNEAHHRIRARLLDALGRAGLKPAVAFEQFDAEYDIALQELLSSGKSTANAVAEAVRFDRKGWNWQFYRPIVEAALEHGMPLRAANLSRARAREAPVEAWPAEKEKILGELIFEGHCRALPRSALPRMVAAQRARDRQMAETLLRPSADGAVLIAGNGHVRLDVGVPAYLPREGVVSVGFLEAAPAGRVPFDYTWATAPAARPDPCAKFLK